ncbi:MAG: DUF5615 family PIN-like protein [Gemmataceae bacterium]|nr:DUF5615 family PIN-like protein [Gemmataceae bacterium]
MNFLADENIDRRVVERLREDGHAIDWITELAPSVADEEVFASVGGCQCCIDHRGLGFRRTGLPPRAVTRGCDAAPTRGVGQCGQD